MFDPQEAAPRCAGARAAAPPRIIQDPGTPDPVVDPGADPWELPFAGDLEARTPEPVVSAPATIRPEIQAAISKYRLVLRCGAGRQA